MTTPIVFDALPGESPAGSYIYVLRFASGVVKVGMTRNAGQRLRQHATSALQYGSEIVDHWVSRPHGGAEANEQALIAFCADRAERTTGNERGEFFTGLEFTPVVEFAKTLPFESAEPVAEASGEEKEAWRAQFVRHFGRRIALPPRGNVPEAWSGSTADASLDLAMLFLDLPREVAKQLDDEDRAQINENLLDALHASQESMALKHFLAEAEMRHDRALFDDRYTLAERLAAKHNVASPHGDRKTTAASLAEVRKQLDEETALPPLQKLQMEMRRFNARTVAAFEREHDLSWRAPDKVFALHRNGIRSSRTRAGDFVTMFTAEDGRYAVEVPAFARALGMSEADLICEYASQDDDFPVLILASADRGTYPVELVLSAAVERITQSNGFGAPVELKRDSLTAVTS
ncbi:GIY-YIG nuclease family protein [Streptomyces sp. NPDC102364]|uniref:GIY-YIG nuclease family protein n=1 Tax=Streptomyces sp. NPDC102364 TaxID=3366161 RepID=UPI0038219ABD